MAKDRTTKSKEITKVGGTQGWLTKYVEEDKSLQGLGQYVVVPRLKQIQGMTDQAVKAAHGEGSIILRPGDALIAKAGEPFEFNPLFFFTEFTKRSDRRDKENPMVIERTFDPNSEIAKRSMNPDKREELYEGHEKKKPQDQWKRRYVQSLCFPGRIVGDHPLAGQEATLIFERGEFTQGRNFISAVTLRRAEVTIDDEVRKVPAPLWSQVWAFTPAHRVKGEKQHWGLDFQPGENDGFIFEDKVEECQQRHIELAKAHDERVLVIDGEPDDEETESKASEM